MEDGMGREREKRRNIGKRVGRRYRGRKSVETLMFSNLPGTQGLIQTNLIMFDNYNHRFKMILLTKYIRVLVCDNQLVHSVFWFSEPLQKCMYSTVFATHISV